MVLDYITSFLNELSKNGRKSRTLKQYQSDLLIFSDWIANLKQQNNAAAIQSLTKDELSSFYEYLNTRNYSDDTIRRLTSVLNRLFIHLDISSFSIPMLVNTPIKRSLCATDFITPHEWSVLTRSMKAHVHSIDSLPIARNCLIDRNVSITLLIRFYGLTPSEIHSIDMNDVNFAQQVIQIRSERATRRVILETEHTKILLKYFNSIPQLLRPRYRTTDPLFIAFNNRSLSYQFDYQLGVPKRLSIRAIQKMIKDEVDRAGLRKISSVNLRNTCIIEALNNRVPDKDLVVHFGFTNSFSLRRYKQYLDFE